METMRIRKAPWGVSYTARVGEIIILFAYAGRDAWGFTLHSGRAARGVLASGRGDSFLKAARAALKAARKVTP